MTLSLWLTKIPQIWWNTKIDLLPPQSRRDLDMFGKAIATGRGRDDPCTRSERRHPFFVPGTRQHRQTDVGTSIEAAQESAQVGANTEIDQFPAIQGQTQCHAAIVTSLY